MTLTKDEALAAVDRAKFETEEGRKILHCFMGNFGADWDAERIEDLIFRADRIEWVDNWFGHDLRVVADGQVHCFDVRRPA